MPSGSRPTAVLYCQVRFGAGHLVRTMSLAEALVPAFRVVLAVSGDSGSDLHAADSIERVVLPEPPDDFFGASGAAAPGLGVSLAALVDRTRASVLLVESFPFGRQNLLVEMGRCLTRLRARVPRPLLVCSTRDIEQRAQPKQSWLDRMALDTANRHFDAILCHTDPAIARFRDTFPLADDLEVPVYETGYVTRPLAHAGTERREPVVVVSAGGGRGGEALLLAAAEAQRRTDLSSDLVMRIFAGTYVLPATWARLNELARSAPRLEVRRWTPDLRAELGRAALSVSRCGYNTALDLLASRAPALVVPFQTPHEDEQTRRAARLAELGMVRVLTEHELTPDTLAAEIRRTAGWTPAPVSVDLDGGRRTRELLQSWVAQRPGA